MRIATITNWAYVATVTLTLVSGVTMLTASRAEDRERAAVEERARFDELTATLEEDTYRLTEQARLYSVNGNPVHLIVYRQEAAQQRPVEARVERLRDAGANAAELDALKAGLRWADSLIDEQQAAIAAVAKGDGTTARAIMFGAEYERDLDRAATLIGRFQSLLDQRTENAVAEATRASRELRSTSEIMLAITALLFLFVLYFIIKQRILRPVVKLSDFVTRLADQDYAAELPEHTQIDEIGDMTQAIRVFRENGLERQRLEAERSADRATRDLLARMTQRLQGCGDTDDLSDVVKLFVAGIAPLLAGRLYIHDRNRDVMVEACNWLAPHCSAPQFPPDQCWALRRGQLHRAGGKKVDITCAHVGEDAERATICVPLTAQGETIGLLYFEQIEGVGHPPVAEVYLELLAETVGLTLANLSLRDELRQMALIDALTGLSNRRQLDTALKAQLAHAEQSRESFSCVMLDVDRFKRFNDMFGHDAGDAVLQAVGNVLANAVRGEGTAFRYGGEEFLLLMPRFGLERARQRCEEIQERVRALQIKHDGEVLGPVTCSFGVATYPDHGAAATLVQTADAALLRAKEEGRDRIVVAVVREPN